MSERISLAKTPAAKKTPVRKAINMPLQLGVEARDLASGFSGILTAKCELLNGCVQWNLTPKDQATEYKGGVTIDYHMLEVLDAGVSAKVPVPSPSNIPLGAIVRDSVSGLKGTATERATFLNGCVYYHVQPKVRRSFWWWLGLGGGEEYPAGIMIEHKRLTVLDPGVSQTPAAVQPIAPKPETPKVAPAPRGPGGPARSMGRIG